MGLDPQMGESSTVLSLIPIGVSPPEMSYMPRIRESVGAYRVEPRRPGDPAILVAASDKARTELG